MNKTIYAGVSKIEITCEEGGTYDALLSEKAKKHIPIEYLGITLKIDDPLFARVLVLDDGLSKIVLVTMDVTAIGGRTISQNILSDSADNFMHDLRQQVEKEFNIPHFAFGLSLVGIALLPGRLFYSGIALVVLGIFSRSGP